ncbi:rab5, putative [Entamoeba invadens IP1]|uniref:Rab5, putative n=1 Tax=Entamoeba invadens IP1 TaxID=370355 RepID=A0A0A1TUH0_ENTIV|nr:rab5, putative [Entamoeba invadens IP1]ELP83675.1 rab5, putative [Entamoeba invadens IP1]|eukprot:XP_004183021.1 rab5, putative [Entamoeba invadens IP1]
MTEGNTYQFKIVLLGDSSVGKSSIVLRVCKGEYKEFQENTIGAAFLTKTLIVDKDTIKFECWDTAGQERYHSLTPMYYRGSNAALVVFDITSDSSYAQAKKWVDELRESANDTMIFLVGNKCDLEGSRSVTKEDAEAYARSISVDYIETSAKSNINVSELFDLVARKLPKTEKGLIDQDEVVISNRNGQKKGCC